MTLRRYQPVSLADELRKLMKEIAVLQRVALRREESSSLDYFSEELETIHAHAEQLSALLRQHAVCPRCQGAKRVKKLDGAGSMTCPVCNRPPTTHAVAEPQVSGIKVREILEESSTEQEVSSGADGVYTYRHCDTYEVANRLNTMLPAAHAAEQPKLTAEQVQKVFIAGKASINTGMAYWEEKANGLNALLTSPVAPPPSKLPTLGGEDYSGKPMSWEELEEAAYNAPLLIPVAPGEQLTEVEILRAAIHAGTENTRVLIEKQREALIAAEDALSNWFSSEYTESDVAKKVRAALYGDKPDKT